jgi:hypothetical protein
MMSQFLVGGVDTHDLFGGFVDLSEVIGGRSPNFGLAPEILPL